MIILAIESSCDAKSRSLASDKQSLSEADDADFSGSQSEPATAILAIESSCDETAVSIYDAKSNTLLSNIVVSQINLFKSYGGVIPEIAARSHLEAILPALDQAFQEAGFILPAPNYNIPINNWDKIDAIAVTHTPGLLGSLLVGTLTARTLAILHHKPLYPVHHLKSHIYSCWINQTPPTFPLLALVISGGHTQIIKMSQENSFQIIGTTLDDAVGECFDKIAKILGLPYPGGPSISQAAQTGDPQKYLFPHPKVSNLDFSFSGLKTAVLRTVQKECGVGLNYPSKDLKHLLSPQQVADFAASFQATACDILLEKLSLALKQNPDTKSVIFAGGVSANNLLREKAHVWSTKKPKHLKLYFPNQHFSGDNAAMVALAATAEIHAGVPPCNPYKLNISPRSTIQ